MDVKETLESLAERLQTTGVRTIFGEPVSAEGRTVIPVARVAYGFGSGGGMKPVDPAHPSDRSGEGAGGGGGARAIPAGVIEITRDKTRFVRFTDWRSPAVAGAVGIGLGIAVARFIGRQRSRA